VPWSSPPDSLFSRENLFLRLCSPSEVKEWVFGVRVTCVNVTQIRRCSDRRGAKAWALPRLHLGSFVQAGVDALEPHGIRDEVNCEYQLFGWSGCFRKSIGFPFWVRPLSTRRGDSRLIVTSRQVLHASGPHILPFARNHVWLPSGCLKMQLISHLFDSPRGRKLEGVRETAGTGGNGKAIPRPQLQFHSSSFGASSVSIFELRCSAWR
jgi:hypothetical protein